ncbi:MAG: carbohydrate-binding protein [Mucilaginibacter sp.]|uniref:carbohydrate-binding protein n=1 Tax=Mucilaginibacter sp. TaxID=1882438 RepID=UPI003263692C
MNRLRVYFNKSTYRIILSAFFLTSSLVAAGQANEPVNGTTGTPLGGFGAGAIKFNASKGTFTLMTRPPADAYDFKTVPGAHFEFYSQRGSTVKSQNVMTAVNKDGHPDDDAIWPLHMVNFGKINDVQIRMTGFSPLDNKDYNNMSLPYAFYEFSVENLSGSPVTVGLALQWALPGEPFSAQPGVGIYSFSRSVSVASSAKSTKVTTGNMDEPNFLATGKCDNTVNGEGGKAAASIELKPHETSVIRFVVAWYDNTDPALAYYFNLANNAQTVGRIGLKNFDLLKENAVCLVNRFRASNLPSWLKNQTLNTLANLSTNSMYKKDGRVGFAEGQWTCFGTMDQMWHARQIVAETVPYFAWQELRYWARTQMKNGQIHHDFNKMGGNGEREKRSVLVDWDDTEHDDYRNIQKWVDLNCAFIISTFEVYQITGDKAQFEFLWPYVKRAAQRIIDQVGLYGNKEFPYTFDQSENSYDAGGEPNPFNANLSAVAYKVMTILAQEQKDLTSVKQYQSAYDQVVKSFANRYLSDEHFKLGNHCESYFAGQWLAFNLKLGQIWTAGNTDYVLNRLDQYYHPLYWGLGNEKGTYDEWTPYILTHYGGLLLNTDRALQWMALQKDAYQRQYQNRDKVFDHPLNILPVVKSAKWTATNTSSDKQYISMPGLWRNYYDLAGYHRDMRTKELWLQPIILAELNHELRNALVFSPEGYGSISCKTYGAADQNKMISFKSDQKISVSTLHLRDDFGKNVSLSINGKSYSFTRGGSGYAKELLIQWNDSIDEKGIQIKVTGDPGSSHPVLPPAPREVQNDGRKTSSQRNAYEIIEAESAEKSAGTTKDTTGTGRVFVTSCNNFDYIQFGSIDFGKEGADQFLARISSVQGGSNIEIVVDNVAGELIGTCAVPNTGSFDTWQTVSSSIKKIKGTHDIILRFSGANSNNLMNIDKIIFNNKDNNPPQGFSK